jgi:tRNA threonylcarbamoyladenosine biosynthesis protein TsaE
MANLSVEVAAPEETAALGRRLGELLFPGAIVALVGQLGAGKTFLVRAIAEGLGVPDSRIISSPTFVLIQEYQGRLPIYHFDTYRLKTPAEFADLGVHEYFQSQGVCLIEWADRVPGILTTARLTIALEPTGETARRIVLTASGTRYEEVLIELRIHNAGAADPTADSSPQNSPRSRA